MADLQYVIGDIEMFNDRDDTKPIQIINRKFLIEAISLDPLENKYSEALKYFGAGYVDSQEEADALITKGGFVEGKGWPIEKGLKLPKLRAIQINHIDLSEGAQIIADKIVKRYG